MPASKPVGKFDRKTLAQFGSKLAPETCAATLYESVALPALLHFAIGLSVDVAMEAKSPFSSGVDDDPQAERRARKERVRIILIFV